MNILELIEKKSNNKKLTEKEIYFFVNGYLNKEIPDYQISSLLMAIKINGMDLEETSILTKSFIDSGSTVDFGDMYVVDKHSTGGIGDKTSIILSPLMAAMGLNVGKLSGRGLGFTGGTVDKLESIKGFSLDIPKDDFIKQVKEIGVALIGQIKDITPADKVFYALRDVTGTVQSYPLIAASIMAKKLANGANHIMLDIKCGEGAFMKNIDEARVLSKIMIDIAKQLDRKVTCVITNMNEPLGEQVGNANEVKEALDLLHGGGPEDIKELCINFAAIAYSEKNNVSIEESKKIAIEKLNDESAFNKLLEWTKAQGGETDKLADDTIFSPEETTDFIAQKDGYMNIIDTSAIGLATLELGAGRHTKEDVIDHQTGLRFYPSQGQKIAKGDLIAHIYHSKSKKGLDNAISLLNERAFEITETKPEVSDLIIEILR